MTEIEALEASQFYMPVLMCIAFNWILFIFTIITENISLVYIFLGPTMIIINGTVLYMNDNWNTRTILTFSLICLYGLRMLIHLSFMNYG